MDWRDELIVEESLQGRLELVDVALGHVSEALVHRVKPGDLGR